MDEQLELGFRGRGSIKASESLRQSNPQTDRVLQQALEFARAELNWLGMESRNIKF